MSFTKEIGVTGPEATWISKPNPVESRPESSICLVCDMRAVYVALSCSGFRLWVRPNPMPSVKKKAVDNATQ